MSDSSFYAHASSIIDEEVTIGAGTKIWHFCHVQSGAKIGNNCSIGQNVYIAANVSVGNNVKIQNNVSIYEGVTLEDYVFCGPSCVFTNVLNPRSKYPQRGGEHYRQTLVGEGATIGANATILCGITVGRHAFIGAGAVVTKDVPAYALLVGNPARQNGWMCECGNKLNNSLECQKCARKYERSDNGIEEI